MLIECYECGKNVSSSAGNCPFCGFPITEAVTSKKYELSNNDINYLRQKNVTGLQKTAYLIEKHYPQHLAFQISMKYQAECDPEFKARRDNAKRQAQQQANAPKCPTCGSTNIEKIGMGKKLFGGAMFGLFSSDVRKTMHCKSCGYKW